MGDSGLSNAPCLAADPFVGTIVYACARHGQVYRWRADKGSGAAGGAGLPDNAAVVALAPDTRAPGVLYAGTSAGFFLSQDRGNTWQARSTGLPKGDTIDAVAAVPGEGANQTAIYAGTPDNGVYVTLDAGRSWRPVNDGLPPGANVNALFWESASRTLFVSLDQGGAFALLPGGRAWVPRGTGLTHPALCFAALTTGGTTTLFAGTSQALFSSGDGGRDWSAVASAPRGQVAALAADPTHPTWLYAGVDSTVYRSQDAGQSWVAVAAPLHQAVNAVLPVDLASTTAVYAAAGQVYRYPPYVPPPASPAETIITLLTLVAAVAVAIWALLRTRRQMVALAQRDRPASPGRQAASQSAASAPTSPGANGHGAGQAGGLGSAASDELPSTNGHSRVPH